MAANAHPNTLFHLVPINHAANDALSHPDNKRFVSRTDNGQFGLEVGYHVPSIPRGHVITRLGRNADIILRRSTPQYPMSAIHVAFEMSPTTHLVLLSVRSKRNSSVRFQILEEEKDSEEQMIAGDGVILYGQNYKIFIASYDFILVWRQVPGATATNIESLTALAVEGYQTSSQLLQHMRSRDQPTEYDVSEAQSWHITRLNTSKRPLFQDIKHLRVERATGAFGKVYQAVDQTSGRLFAIKVVDLAKFPNIEAARAILHREIKVMERIEHKHIIEYPGYQHFHSCYPEIFMPLRDGSVTSLAKSPTLTMEHDQLSLSVLEQILSALDYLANENLIHRDVKPDNILYSEMGDGNYHFQLADFGLANHRSLARTVCGTGYFQAPELWPHESKVNAAQSPKLDIWSLFASIVAIHTMFKEFPLQNSDYRGILSTLKAKAQDSPKLEPMARLHPDSRASAAQMLVRLFGGKGLTTPISMIPSIKPNFEPRPSSSAAARSTKRPTAKKDVGRACQRPTAPARPLIVYPPRKRAPLLVQHDDHLSREFSVLTNPISSPKQTTTRLTHKRADRDGVGKRRTERPSTRTNAPPRLPPERGPVPDQSPSALEKSPTVGLRVPGMFIE